MLSPRIILAVDDGDCAVVVVAMFITDSLLLVAVYRESKSQERYREKRIIPALIVCYISSPIIMAPSSGHVSSVADQSQRHPRPSASPVDQYKLASACSSRTNRAYSL